MQEQIFSKSFSRHFAESPHENLGQWFPIIHVSLRDFFLRVNHNLRDSTFERYANLSPNRISHERCIQYLHTILRKSWKEKKKKKTDKSHWTRNAGETAIPNGHGVNLFLADACPLLCKLSTRDRLRNRLTMGDRARVCVAVSTGC